MEKVHTRVIKIAGNVITVAAEGVAYGELAEVRSAHGVSLAQVIRLEGDQVALQVFEGSRGIATNDEVRFLGHPMRLSFSEDVLGRVFTGSGRPRDKGPTLDGNWIEIAGPSVNPAKRIIPRNMVRTGIPMIDVFNSLVESQKLPIFSVAGEPYNELLARIAMQAEVDIIIFGGMGLKHDDYLYFRDTFEEEGALVRTVMCVHTAADPIVECLLVPDMCLAMAEKFALDGKRVLVLLTDMTNFADAMKEIAITMEQVPSNRGYPGDLYSQLAARYEKAVDFDEAGSITILAVTTMPGDDVTHPIPDNTGYITEGQFYLRNGRIEPFGSLSRLKQQVNDKTREDHRTIMNTMIQLYAQCRETQEKLSMGFTMSTWDKKLLKYGGLFEKRLMDLSVNIPLEKALDTCWEILAECFAPNEVGVKRSLREAFWPKSNGAAEHDENAAEESEEESEEAHDKEKNAEASADEKEGKKDAAGEKDIDTDDAPAPNDNDDEDDASKKAEGKKDAAGEKDIDTDDASATNDNDDEDDASKKAEGKKDAAGEKDIDTDDASKKAEGKKDAAGEKDIDTDDASATNDNDDEDDASKKADTSSDTNA